VQLILASGSPRRRELLERLGHPFTVETSRVDETPRPGESPHELARRLALAKARDVAARHTRGLVIGADTVVALGDRIFGKPVDEADAATMLRALRGGPHLVVTGIAVVRASDYATRSTVVPATVRMRPYSDSEIDAYVASGEPLDKAGAYGAQGAGARLIERVEGPFLTVVGLPMDDLIALVRDLGLDIERRGLSRDE
jgi:septum formation protein